MKTCPYCQTKAIIVNCKRSKLEKLFTWFRSKWFPSVKHLTDGEACLRKRLTRSEERRLHTLATLCDFRSAVLEDTYISDEVREAMLGHLDTAQMENQYED